LYSPKRDRYSPERLAMVGQLRRAIEGRELVLHYQPKVDLVRGRISGVEALVRWNHPEQGLLAAGAFVPLTEHTGLIRSLTSLVLEDAIRQCAEWRAQGFDIPVAVNLSVRNLHDAQLPEEVAALLRAHGVPASALTLEITESAIMLDPYRAMGVLARLSAMGLGLSIDDFGSGHSSLAYLKRLPVSELKIDRSFVQYMSSEPNDAAIVRTTVELGRNLGLEVVAEGVEDEGAVERLLSFGCELAQGYHLGRPAPAKAITELLEAERGADVGAADAAPGLRAS
ncbi:MAG: EAL domain-containing protein, partial [Actinomycetota bacterium]|nr:EAL domain-containing protein [Actinomycetota bacterium]